MEASLALTGLLMGLAGGPHCLAMCGPICAPLARGVRSVPVLQPGRARRPSLLLGSAWVAFQGGRLLAYGALGAIAAGSVQAIGWLSVHSAMVRPLWTFFHVAAALLGGLLLWQGRQPAWIDEAARRVWSRMRPIAGDQTLSSRRRAAWILGMGCAFLPCGLLYSALMVAALGGGMAAGAAIMALFALGSGLGLMLGPWLWAAAGAAGSSSRAVRLAGAALLAVSLWALWMALMEQRAPWCLTPPSAV